MGPVGRESRFMPTVKCSTCGNQVEISLMGEHICSGLSSTESTPPMSSPSLFGRLMPAFGNPLTQKQQPRAPPQLDTLAANRAFMGHGQLTPMSDSSSSQASSMSPQTADPRPDAINTDDNFSPQIANSPPSPPEAFRANGHGALEDRIGYNFNQKKQPLMDPISETTPEPLNPARRPSAGPGTKDNNRRPSTARSNLSISSRSGTMPPPARQNSHGGFGAEPPLMTPSRSETFPRPSDRFAPPQRTPSAPLSSTGPRQERPRPSIEPPENSSGRVSLTSERPRRPSRGPDTMRPPPPRTSLVRPKTPGVPTINLTEEFGVGNPYHASSESTSSSNSVNSSVPERRPSAASQISQASSRTSPPRSIASRSGRNPSDAGSFDNLMSDIQSSMEEIKPRPTVAPLKLPPREMGARPPPLSARPPRTGGYDPRIDPAQNRSARPRSPLPSPGGSTPWPDGLTVQKPSDVRTPSTPGFPSPRWANSPEQMPSNGYFPPQPRPQPGQQQQPQPQHEHQPPPQQRSPPRSRSRPSQSDRRPPSRRHEPSQQPLPTPPPQHSLPTPSPAPLSAASPTTHKPSRSTHNVNPFLFQPPPHYPHNNLPHPNYQPTPRTAPPPQAPEATANPASSPSPENPSPPPTGASQAATTSRASSARPAASPLPPPHSMSWTINRIVRLTIMC